MFLPGKGPSRFDPWLPGFPSRPCRGLLPCQPRPTIASPRPLQPPTTDGSLENTARPKPGILARVRPRPRARDPSTTSWQHTAVHGPHTSCGQKSPSKPWGPPGERNRGLHRPQPFSCLSKPGYFPLSPASRPVPGWLWEQDPQLHPLVSSSCLQGGE